MNVHVALIQHKHGNNVYLDITEPGLFEQIADYCRETDSIVLTDPFNYDESVIPQSLGESA